MADHYHGDEQPIVVDGIDDAVVANPDPPEVISPCKLDNAFRPRLVAQSLSRISNAPKCVPRELA